MPKQREITEISIFVASPGDVQEERNCLKRVISELNQVYEQSDSSLRLKSFFWEDDSLPGMGTDPQDVVNRQAPDDYDLFVGKMGTTVGTPTPRGRSGTIEEYEKALERHRHATNSVNIWFYFKDKIDTPVSQLDLDELKKVNDFRGELSSKAVHVPYDSISEYEGTVRRHLQVYVEKEINQIKKGQLVVSEKVSIKTENVKEDDTDLGLFDLQTEMNSASDEFLESLGNISKFTSDMAGRVKSKATEIGESSEKGMLTQKEQRRVINAVADDMDHYNQLVSTEGNLYQSVLASHAELAEQERLRPQRISSDVTEDRVHFAGFVPAS